MIVKHALIAVVLTGCWIAPAEPPTPDREWRRVTTTGITPAPVLGPRGAYDGKRGQIMYYGGRTGSDAIVNHVVYASGVWSDPCPGCTPPGTRFGNAFGYDSRRDRYVLAGGSPVYTEPPAENALDEVWEFDPNTSEWRRVGPLPEPRTGGFLIDDTARGVLVLVGGANSTGVLDKVYEYDGTTWRPRDVGPMRPFGTGGFGTTVTYDSQLGRILALVDVREYDVTGAMDFDELWELTDRWRRLCTQCSMLPRRSASIVWSGGEAWTYLMNGYNGDEIAGTWRFDDTMQRFLALDPASPGKRDSTSVIYDPRSDKVVLYGGNGDDCAPSADCNDVLEYVRR